MKLNLSKSSTTTKLVASNTINKFPMDIQETINAHHGHHHRPIHYSLCRVEMSLPFMKLQPNVSIHNWLHYFILIQSYSSKSLVFFSFFFYIFGFTIYLSFVNHEPSATHAHLLHLRKGVGGIRCDPGQWLLIYQWQPRILGLNRKIYHLPSGYLT